MSAGRTLVAGFGNELRGDDGFGIAVLRALGTALPPGSPVDLLEVGTGGIRLAQELLGSYDALVIVDAMRGDGQPGTIYVREVVDVDPIHEIDLHMATPSRALSLARALGALPPRVHLVGCEPVEVDELLLSLSPPVRDAVAPAVARILGLVGMGGSPDTRAERGGGEVTDDRPQSQVARLDEVLELLYWLEGEGFEGEATLAGIARFLTYPEAEVSRVVARLVERGDVTRGGASGAGDGGLRGRASDGAPGTVRYRLTEIGRREAARRFAEQFAPLLAQGHGECNDPDCDCHETGAAECHAARASSGHRH